MRSPEWRDAWEDPAREAKAVVVAEGLVCQPKQVRMNDEVK